MAEPFETLREVGVALDGFRVDVSGQFGTLKWLIGGFAAAGLVVSGVFFNKIDALEETAARNTAILERIESQLEMVAASTDTIKETIQTASALPSAGSFDGYVGVKAPKVDFRGIMTDDTPLAVLKMFGESNDNWIYVPQQ